MNRVIKILEILEIFFHRGPQGLSIYNDKLANPHLEELTEDIIHSNEHPENIKISELMQIAIEFVKDNKETIVEMFPVEDSPLCDKNLYDKINPILFDLSNDHPEQFKLNIPWFLSTQEDMTSYAESVMLIREELLKFKNGFENAKVGEISSVPEKIFSKINNLDSRYFKIYFKDLVLKLSSLIESLFKRIFILLNLIWKLEKDQETALNLLKDKTIGQLFRDMNIRYNYPNLDRLRVYRNKMFHSKINFNNEDKWGNRRIKLRNNINLSTNDVLVDFLKVFFFITTFELMIYNLKMTMNGNINEDRLIDKL